MIQGTLCALLSKLSTHYPDFLSNITKGLQEEEISKATVLFVQEVMANIKPGTTKTKLRRLIRQSSLNSDRPQPSIVRSLERDDSISGEFGGLHVAKCDLCDLSFQSTVEAQVHGLAHRDVTTAYLSCALCNQMKKYSKVDALRQHLKCHAKLQQQQDVAAAAATAMQQHMQDPLLTNFVAPAGIIQYLNQQQQQLQKTLSEDHGLFVRDHNSATGRERPVRMKREVSCPGEFAAVSSAEGTDAAVSDGEVPVAAAGRVKRLRFSEPPVVEPAAAGDAAAQVFHCHECDVSFPLDDFTDFCQHLQQHVDMTKQFRCHVCKKRFVGDQIRAFVRHLCSHMIGDGDNSQQQLHCSRCGATFAADEIDEFYGHVAQHKQLEIFRCNTCSRRFASSREVLEHFTPEMGEAGSSACGVACAVSCGICEGGNKRGGSASELPGSRPSNLAQLIEHIGANHADMKARCVTDLYACNKCVGSSPCVAYTERSPLAYQQHLLQKHGIYLHVCMLCLASFSDQRALTEHLSAAHTSEATASSMAASKQPEKQINVSSIMSAVYKALTSDELHCCHRCGIYFEQERVYSAHMLHHEGGSGPADGISCDLCHAAFNTNLDLAQHLMAATCTT